ncbi:carbohydrate-binding protein [Bacteroides ovatus]|uniref:carbohydrate-binding protein n=1 Tax=Bacteroides ovatus TaxID=28116 RepID=UPI003378DB68|nr:hypothetical protein BOVA208_3988 [Bacteroides ovatus]
MDFRVAPLSKSIVEIRIDNKNGPLIGTLKLNKSGEGDIWRTMTTKVKKRPEYMTYILFLKLKKNC